MLQELLYLPAPPASGDERVVNVDQLFGILDQVVAIQGGTKLSPGRVIRKLQNGVRLSCGRGCVFKWCSVDRSAAVTNDESTMESASRSSSRTPYSSCNVNPSCSSSPQAPHP